MPLLAKAWRSLRKKDHLLDKSRCIDSATFHGGLDKKHHNIVDGGFPCRPVYHRKNELWIPSSHGERTDEILSRGRCYNNDW